MNPQVLGEHLQFIDPVLSQAATGRARWDPDRYAWDGASTEPQGRSEP